MNKYFILLFLGILLYRGNAQEGVANPSNESLNVISNVDNYNPESQAFLSPDADYPYSNKALLLVHSDRTEYGDVNDFIIPYLDYFGVPYDIVDLKSASLPDLESYAVIIFGHKNVYLSNYPITQMETAIANGIGLYSFDSHLFDYTSAFNQVVTTQTITRVLTIEFSNTTHYITQKHLPDSYNPNSNLITLPYPSTLGNADWTLNNSSNLINGSVLIEAADASLTLPLMEVSSYGDGRVVKWNGTRWMSKKVLGSMYGMDDAIWKGIVWAARKPFVMLGLPPFVTMRVDDVKGTGTDLTNNFQWVTICNSYGWKPWLGTFNTSLNPAYIPTLRSLIDNSTVTASPHAFSDYSWIYYNHYGQQGFDPVANCENARNFYIQNNLKLSKYFVPHFYELSTASIPELVKMNFEFIGITLEPDQGYGNTPWIHCGPYNKVDFRRVDNPSPVFHCDYVEFDGTRFFNVVTEIRDDGSYEWYPMYLPGDDITTTVARGVRHLRRAFDAMALPVLFTHEYFFDDISVSDWNTIMANVTTGISSYSPMFTTMDFAAQYLRAKKNTQITSVTDNLSSIEIGYTADNDIGIKCHIFKEVSGQIVFELVDLPQLNGSGSITVLQ
jgi:hypothetical protein